MPLPGSNREKKMLSEMAAKPAKAAPAPAKTFLQEVVEPDVIAPVELEVAEVEEEEEVAEEE